MVTCTSSSSGRRQALPARILHGSLLYLEHPWLLLCSALGSNPISWESLSQQPGLLINLRHPSTTVHTLPCSSLQGTHHYGRFSYLTLVASPAILFVSPIVGRPTFWGTWYPCDSQQCWPSVGNHSSIFRKGGRKGRRVGGKMRRRDYKPLSWNPDLSICCDVGCNSCYLSPWEADLCPLPLSLEGCCHCWTHKIQ